MRSVAGAHFLFDWNPAACDAGFSLSDAYPGDAYVDIIGIDAYDTDCESHASVAEEGWLPYLQSGGEGSIASIMNFARVNGKPISFPEWGLVGSDDPTYVDGIASIIATSDVAYQSYFDCGCDNITPLGSGAPNSLAAYKYAFGG
jgi:beta-mannanase